MSTHDLIIKQYVVCPHTGKQICIDDNECKNCCHRGDDYYWYTLSDPTLHFTCYYGDTYFDSFLRSLWDNTNMYGGWGKLPLPKECLKFEVPTCKSCEKRGTSDCHALESLIKYRETEYQKYLKLEKQKQKSKNKKQRGCEIDWVL